MESQAAGIPVIVSGRGGLPETVPDEYLIVNDLFNIEEWKVKINTVLSKSRYSHYSRICAENSKKFAGSGQISRFRKILKERLGYRI